MNKKLTKTIILIVFVVFLGITKVEAKTAKTCVYELGAMIIKISINDSYSTATIEKGSEAHGKVKNWDSGHKSGFSGYDYFAENNHNCPPVLLQEKNLFADDVWFADVENMQKVKDYIDDEVWMYDLVSNLDGAGSHGDTSNDNSVTTITSKKCSCSGTDKGKKISVTFDVSDTLTAPRPTIKFGDDTNKETIQNWDKPLSTRSGFLNLKSHDSTYTYIRDLTKNNKCPDYALLYRGGGYFLVVSDEENLSEVKGALKEHLTGDGIVYTVGCQETVVDDTPPTSNEPPKTSNEPEDPSVTSNVTPLSPDFDTYSCGGSYLTGIPSKIPKLTKFIYIFLQVLVPIAIIILGSLDLLKAVGGQKEDEIKKGQQVFIKRLVGAAIVFFVFAIVKFAVSLVSDNSTSIIDCIDCFLKNNDSCIEE